jgi:C-terminal processing protease CtpA/Prc
MADYPPSVDLRLLALFRLWNIIERFYPYKSLLEKPWDDALAAFLPRFETTEGGHAYIELVADLIARLPDSHVQLYGGDDAVVNPPAQPPFMARFIEKQPVVVALAHDAAGLSIGDTIVAVDGEPIADRIARVRRFVASSSAVAREQIALTRALGGGNGSTMVVTVRGATGAPHDVRLLRRLYGPHEISWRTSDVVSILDGAVGYVDLERLRPQDVDAMFDQLRDTRAIIFDLRGYPRGTGFTIAARLNVRHAGPAAEFERCVVSVASTGPGECDRYRFTQGLSPTPPGEPLYHGGVVLLVDERTVSQAEHTALLFEAAAAPKLVGSHTAGTNGDVTALMLPGGLAMSFTGHSVRHADGRALQLTGLPIDYLVEPTIAGIRRGRDEVIERALKVLGGGQHRRPE